MSLAACASSRLRSVPSWLRARITRCPRRSALGQSLFGEKVGALLHRLFGFSPKAQITQARAAADQLLVELGSPDQACLSLDGQVRSQFHGHAAQALRVVLAAPLGHARHLS